VEVSAGPLTREGRAMLDLTVRLVARFYPRLCFHGGLAGEDRFHQTSYFD